MLALVQVPEHGDAVFATRSSERIIRGDGDSVDVTGVSVVVGLQFELGEFPDLRYGFSDYFKTLLIVKRASEILVEMLSH